MIRAKVEKILKLENKSFVGMENAAKKFGQKKRRENSPAPLLFLFSFSSRNIVRRTLRFAGSQP